MESPHRSDHGRRSRRGWFSRPKASLPSPEIQEAQARERLYARPDVNERTVELLGPAPRMVDRPAA